jgi:hypothetical protein
LNFAQLPRPDRRSCRWPVSGIRCGWPGSPDRGDTKTCREHTTHHLGEAAPFPLDGQPTDYRLPATRCEPGSLPPQARPRVRLVQQDPRLGISGMYALRRRMHAERRLRKTARCRKTQGRTATTASSQVIGSGRQLQKDLLAPLASGPKFEAAKTSCPPRQSALRRHRHEPRRTQHRTSTGQVTRDDEGCPQVSTKPAPASPTSFSGVKPARLRPAHLPRSTNL